MATTHLTESQMVRAADAAMADDERARCEAHMAACAECRALVADQRAAHALLAARPIVPVRDVASLVRATLAADRPWIEQLNWRAWTLRVAPVAAALLLAAGLMLSSAASARDSATAASNTTAASSLRTGSAGSPAATPAQTAGTSTPATVASALWNGGVSDDQLLTLFLRARPDDALSTYVQEK